MSVKHLQKQYDDVRPPQVFIDRIRPLAAGYNGPVIPGNHQPFPFEDVQVAIQRLTGRSGVEFMAVFLALQDRELNGTSDRSCPLIVQTLACVCD